jgi:hypothetical protein
MVLAAVMVVVAVVVVVVVPYFTVLYCNFNGKHWAIVDPKLSKSPRDPDCCGPNYEEPLYIVQLSEREVLFMAF